MSNYIKTVLNSLKKQTNRIFSNSQVIYSDELESVAISACVIIINIESSELKISNSRVLNSVHKKDYEYKRRVNITGSFLNTNFTTNGFIEMNTGLFKWMNSAPRFTNHSTVNNQCLEYEKVDAMHFLHLDNNVINTGKGWSVGFTYYPPIGILENCLVPKIKELDYDIKIKIDKEIVNNGK